MFTLADKEMLEVRREAKYKAECALADSLDMLAVLVPMPVKEKAEKVYCYCSLKGANATFVAFYTADGKAVLHSDALNKSELMEFNMAVMSQIVYLKSQYEDCMELMPSELFLEFDPVSRDTKAFAGMENYSDPNEVSIRSLIWFKEHGGKLPRTAELAMKMGRFKAQAEAARNPAGNAVELDKAALNLSRNYVAGEGDEPALLKPETGWDAVRAEMGRVYKGDTVPMSFESDDGKTWVDVYDGNASWHYISCGLGAVGYEAAEACIGSEYTISLKKKSNQDEDDLQIFAVLDLMRAAVAKAQQDGALMADYTWLSAENGGLLVLPEEKLKAVEAPGGSIGFKRLLYITETELKALESGSIEPASLHKQLGDSSVYGRK